jgi:pyruvate/2-oxoglutarate dehydrogenase complex dihydrolipoamide acyltransferase (E2) component
MAILQEIKVPLISVNDTSLTVADVLFGSGDKVNQGDIIMIFETSKTTYDVQAEVTGYIEYLCEQGNDYDVNDIVAKIFSEESEVEKKVIQPKNKTASKIKVVIAEQIWEGDTLFSAAALSLIESKKVDKNNFSGKDFVSLQDVEEVLGITKKKVAEVSKHTSAKKTINTSIDNQKVIIEKLSSNKKREIEYLSEVQSVGLTSTINTIVETEGIFVLLNQSLKALKNSLLPVIIYETARLLNKYPELNSYFTGTEIAKYKEVNVGFAIDIDKGLKVLKIADTDRKSIQAIEGEIIDLSGKYLDNILQVDELTDITFTITDLSSEGVAFFRPLINMMNSAILGVSSIDEKLQRCVLSVTFDHRVTEGKKVAQFLKELKDRLESYRSVYHPKLNQNITCFKCFKTLKEDLSDVGFAKCISPDGNEAYICQSCLKGF